MSAVISRAEVVGGHDGRAEILVELRYANGGTTTIALDEEACSASLDAAGVTSVEGLIGRPWTAVLPALRPVDPPNAPPAQPGGTHARSRHP